MESPSEQEPRSSDFMPLQPGRPAWLEFAMGLSLFSIAISVFAVVQGIAIHHFVSAQDPDVARVPFGLGWFSDSLVKEALLKHERNGDLIALETIWSGLLCSLVILLTCWLWKRSGVKVLLGLALPRFIELMKWLVLFALVVAGVEVIGQLIPSLGTDFMKDVVGSSTDLIKLALGVVVLGPLFEELLLRGLLFGTVRHIADEHVSVAVTAGVFALMHLQYSVPIMLLIIPLGVVLGYARARSGSILVPIVLHMANNSLSVLWP
ncbi:MAG: CPBP family intramembrane metalloprotease [Flavobacteriales bacterium]|jgi:membrane protease YdiL (CAAX protease family)|nr:CPBP family intramembrane metalloprotease [Flavobacteriales bacterium]